MASNELNAGKCFHAFAALWYGLVIVQLLKAVAIVLATRHDILFEQFGCGLQYFTMWNLVAQAFYFFASAYHDFVDESPSNKELKTKLNVWLSPFFHGLVFPTGIYTAFTYWIIASIDSSLIDPYQPQALESVLKDINHSMHTTIAPIVILELFLSNRPNVFSKTELFGLTLLVQTLYGFVVVFLYLIGGRWPYPIVGMVSFYTITAYAVIQSCVGILCQRICYRMQDYNFRWLRSTVVPHFKLS